MPAAPAAPASTSAPPTRFPAPYQLDARRCISYLTIEHEGPIPHEFRAAIGNRIYGCDDCLSVCPWNKFAQGARETKLQARADLRSPPLAQFLSLTEPEFRAFFSGSAVKRIGRDRFIRNVLIAAGNSGEKNLEPLVAPHLSDPNPLVRGAAIWAYKHLASKKQFVTARLAGCLRNGFERKGRMAEIRRKPDLRPFHLWPWLFRTAHCAPCQISRF